MLANDPETARFNMIAQQIRPWEVIDERVLHLYEAIPRERFVGDERMVIVEDFEDETKTTLGELAAETLQTLGVSSAD